MDINEDDIALGNEPEFETFEEGDYSTKKKPEQNYSDNVQKRINKVIYERNVEREKRQELEQRLAAIEENLVKRQTEEQVGNLTSKMSELKQKKATLLEEGDYSGAAELDDEFLELKLKHREAAQPREQRQVEPPRQEIPEAQIKWLEENDWYHNPLKSEQRKKLDQAYVDLLGEGFDPSDEETYKELDNRIKKVSRQSPPAQRQSRGGGSEQAPTATFTQDDARLMRDFNLDPNDPKARAEFMKEKAGAFND